MSLNKLKLYLNVIRDGETGNKLKDNCKKCGIIMMMSFVFLLFLVLLASISYLLAKYTPFHATMYKTDDTLIICNGESFNNIGECIIMGGSYIFLFFILAVMSFIFYSDLRDDRKEGILTKKTLIIKIIVFAIIIGIIFSITAFIYHSGAIGFYLESNGYMKHDHIRKYNNEIKPCYFNQTINNYSRDCVDLFMDLSGMIFLIILVVFLVLCIILCICKCCHEEYSESVEADLKSMKNTDLELVTLNDTKIEN